MPARRLCHASLFLLAGANSPASAQQILVCCKREWPILPAHLCFPDDHGFHHRLPELRLSGHRANAAHGRLPVFLQLQGLR
jgi:hypothetical protein